VQGLEMDVRRCGDGAIVVIHDDTIDRTTTGRGRVADLSIDELQRFDAGRGDCIPRLSDILGSFGSRCLLNVELKETGLTADVGRLICDRGLQGQVLISAFDRDDIGTKAQSSWDELAELASIMPVALICSRSKLDSIGAQALVSEAVRLGATAVHPQIGSELATLLPAAREAGLRVHVWTVNYPDEIAHVRRLGVDGLFTDFPQMGAQP
jgi:glycerophosphoryl diester phosphodiesterase